MFEQLTPEEQLAVDQFAAVKESQIEELVVDQMLDPDCVVAAVQAVLKGNKSARDYMADLLMGHGDRVVNLAYLKLDCMDWIRRQLTAEIEAGDV